MSRAVQIILNNRIDAVDIDNTDVVLFQQNYSSVILNENEIAVSALTTPEKDALTLLLDRLTYSIETDAYVWKVVRTGKTFSLENSYFRNAEDTTTLGEVALNTPLLVLVEFPGFESNFVFELSLWYNNDFLTTQLEDLRDRGVIVTGNGKEFTIDNTVDIRLSFANPDPLTEVYVITHQPEIVSV